MEKEREWRVLRGENEERKEKERGFRQERIKGVEREERKEEKDREKECMDGRKRRLGVDRRGSRKGEYLEA